MSTPNATKHRRRRRNGHEPRIVADVHTTLPAVPTPLPPGTEQAGTYGPSQHVPTFGGLLQALRRRWLLAFGLGIPAALFAAVAAWHLFPPKFTAQTLLHLSSRVPENAFLAPEFRGELPVFQRTTQASLKTRSVLEGALAYLPREKCPTLEDEGNPVAWLERSVQGDFLLGQEILRLTMKGDNPEELALVLNAVTSSYFDYANKLNQSKRKEHLDQLLGTFGKQEQELLPKQKRLRQLEQEAALEDPATVTANYQAAYQVLTVAEEKLQRNVLEQKRLELEIVGLQAKQRVPTPVAVPEALIDEAMSRDPFAIKQQERLDKLQLDIDETIKVSGKKEQEPTLQPLYAERKKLEEIINKKRDEHRAKLTEQLQGKLRLDDVAAQSKMEGELQVAKEQQAAFVEEVTKRRAEVERLKNKPTVEIDNLRSETSQAEVELKKLGARIEALKAEPSQTHRVTLVEAATPPQFSSKEKQLRLVATAGLGTLLLIVGGITLLELRAQKVTSVNEVMQVAGMNVVGALPRVSPRVRRRILQARPTEGTESAWPSMLTESIDATRTLLLHAARHEPLRVVQITSALSGEGKTSLATQLASSLARAGQKTLLIDADLRLPTAHKALGLSLSPGLHDLLRGEASPDDVLRATAIPNLFMITAGAGDWRSLQGLSSSLLRTLFLELREQYDFVIVDSSPVLPVADAMQIGQHVDGVLFAILRDVSRLPMVQAAQQRLAALGVKLLGAVVIGTKEETCYASYPRC